MPSAGNQQKTDIPRKRLAGRLKEQRCKPMDYKHLNDLKIY
jgi:hypothetical protein